VWTKKGADLENFQQGEIPTALKLDYFELPILGKFKYATSPQFGSGGPFGVFGPTIGINTRANVSVVGGDENIAEHVSDADFGLTFGAGYDFIVGNAVTTIEVRYVLGLVDVFDSDAPAPAATADRQNRALQITVGLSKSIF
jgi:outer membrane protein with beta-barrel domain